jgi:hypothetical protein
LLAGGQPVKVIAESIGKSFQTVYREISRNRKPDGRYQPWYAHNQATLRRRRSKAHRVIAGSQLHAVITEKLGRRWSPQQISRYLKRTFPHDPPCAVRPRPSIRPSTPAGSDRKQDDSELGAAAETTTPRGAPDTPDQEHPAHHRPAPPRLPIAAKSATGKET